MNTQVTASRDVVSPAGGATGRAGPRWALRAYVIAGGIFAVGVLAQVFLAGGAIFAGAGWWPAHAMFGMILSLGPIVLLGLAFAARLGARTTWLTALLLALVVVQSMLPTLPAQLGVPILAALHPVNAVIIFALAWLLTLRVWEHAAR